jgi:hypothetical protein
VLVVVIVVTATVGFGGGDSGATTSTTAATTPQNLASVRLEPPGGGGASGSAVFGVTSDSQLYVDVELSGLDPAPDGKAYVMWFLLSPKLGYPVPSVLRVSEGGTFRDRITIPATELAIAQRASSLDISLAPVTAIEASIKSAFKQRRLVRKPGSTVLSGRIPASRQGSGAGSSNGQ